MAVGRCTIDGGAVLTAGTRDNAGGHVAIRRAGCAVPPADEGARTTWYTARSSLTPAWAPRAGPSLCDSTWRMI